MIGTRNKKVQYNGSGKYLYENDKIEEKIVSNLSNLRNFPTDLTNGKYLEINFASPQTKIKAIIYHKKLKIKPPTNRAKVPKVIP